MTTKKTNAAKAATESKEKTEKTGKTERTKKETQEQRAPELTSAGIFHTFERAIPKGATVENVLNGAAMIIGSSLMQMKATRQDLHAILMHLEDVVLDKVKLRDNKVT